MIYNSDLKFANTSKQQLSWYLLPQHWPMSELYCSHALMSIRMTHFFKNAHAHLLNETWWNELEYCAICDNVYKQKRTPPRDKGSLLTAWEN